MPVNVKNAQRRELHFETLDEVLAEAETFTEQSITTGNWNAAENIYHVAYLIGILNRGADFSAPWFMRCLGRVLKLLGQHTKPIKPGFKPPAKIVEAFAPPEGVTLEEALRKLRDEVNYANAHGMHHPSPLFGRLSQEDAVRMNCRHAELHFGFVQPPPLESMGA